jgi:DNA polymerase-4
MGTPIKVGVVLTHLVPDDSATLPLFAGHERLDDLADCMDRIDQKFGHHTLYLGAMWGAEQTAPTRISFDQIPGLDEF